jgi:hypothetical protein
MLRERLLCRMVKNVDLDEAEKESPQHGVTREYISSGRYRQDAHGQLKSRFLASNSSLLMSPRA